MKASPWALLLFTCLGFFFLQRNGVDSISSGTSRVFYNIGHMANEITQVEKHLAEGANGLEINVQFSPEGLPIRTRHGIPCCFLNCFASEVFSYMLQYLRDLSTPEHPTYMSQLALIIFDLRVRGQSEQMLYTSGERLAEAFMVYLFDGGYSGSNVWVLLSVPSPQHVVLFQGVRDTFRKYQMSGLLDRIGYNIGDNTDLLTVDRTLDHLGIIDHIWIADGSPRCFGGIRSTSRIQRLIEERDIGEAHFDGIYRWTIDEPLAMRNSLRIGVDGIVTNRPDRLLEVLGEDEFYGRFRLATADDRPWEKVIEESELGFLPPTELFSSQGSTGSASSSDSIGLPSSSIVFDSTSSGGGDSKKGPKDCDKPSESLSDDASLASLLDDISDVESKDIASSTNSATEKPSSSADDDAAFAALFGEESTTSKSETKKSVSARSTEDSLKLNVRSLLSQMEIERALGSAAERRDDKVRAELLQLLAQTYTTTPPPGISASAIRALLSLQSPVTQSPTVPLNVLQALMNPTYSNPSSGLLQLLAGIQPTTPQISPDVLRTLLDLYAPATTSPSIPVDTLKALLGIPNTQSSDMIEKLKLLALLQPGSRTGTIPDLLSPRPSSSGISFETLKALLSEIEREKKLDVALKDDFVDKEKRIAEEPALPSQSEDKRKNLQGKDAEEEVKSSSSSKTVVKESTSTEIHSSQDSGSNTVRGTANLTRNFPFPPEGPEGFGSPPIPPNPGTSLLVNFGNDGAYWKILDKPNGPFPPPFPPQHPFPPFGNPLPLPYHFQGLRPIHANGGYRNNNLLFKGNLPNTLTIHPPVTFPNPGGRPFYQRPIGPIRLPNRINIYTQVGKPLPPPKIPQPRPYYPNPIVVPSLTTPCPEPLPVRQRPPQHSYAYHTHYHTHVSPEPVGPPPPEEPNPPGPPILIPVFEGGNLGPPQFLDDFEKSGNKTFNDDVPREFFASLVGVKTGTESTNSTSTGTTKQEDDLDLDIEDFGDILGGPTEDTLLGRGVKTSTERSIAVSRSDEDISVDGILGELKSNGRSKTTTPENPTTTFNSMFLTQDPLQELVAAFKKINNDKDAVAAFLRRVNLSLPEESTTGRTQNMVEAVSEELVEEPLAKPVFTKRNTSSDKTRGLAEVLGLPETPGLGWNGQSLDQRRLNPLLPSTTDSKKPVDVIVIENFPVIVVPPTHMPTPRPFPDVQATHTAVHKRETTPPPEEEEEPVTFPIRDIIMRRPDVIQRPIHQDRPRWPIDNSIRPPNNLGRPEVFGQKPRPVGATAAITISKPSEGLDGLIRQVVPVPIEELELPVYDAEDVTLEGPNAAGLPDGELEIIIPSELFTRKSADEGTSSTDNESTTTSKFEESYFDDQSDITTDKLLDGEFEIEIPAELMVQNKVQQRPLDGTGSSFHKRPEAKPSSEVTTANLLRSEEMTEEGTIDRVGNEKAYQNGNSSSTTSASSGSNSSNIIQSHLQSISSPPTHLPVALVDPALTFNVRPLPRREDSSNMSVKGSSIQRTSLEGSLREPSRQQYSHPLKKTESFGRNRTTSELLMTQMQKSDNETTNFKAVDNPLPSDGNANNGGLTEIARVRFEGPQTLNPKVTVDVNVQVFKGSNYDRQPSAVFGSSNSNGKTRDELQRLRDFDLNKQKDVVASQMEHQWTLPERRTVTTTPTSARRSHTLSLRKPKSPLYAVPANPTTPYPPGSVQRRPPYSLKQNAPKVLVQHRGSATPPQKFARDGRLGPSMSRNRNVQLLVTTEVPTYRVFTATMNDVRVGKNTRSDQTNQQKVASTHLLEVDRRLRNPVSISRSSGHGKGLDG